MENEVQPSVIQIAECLADWYKIAQIQYLQAQILDRDIDTYKVRLTEITNEVCEVDVNFHEGVMSISRVICTANSKHGGRIKAQDIKKHRTILDDLKTTLGDVNVEINESEKLSNQIYSIANGNDDGIDLEKNCLVRFPAPTV